MQGFVQGHTSDGRAVILVQVTRHILPVTTIIKLTKKMSALVENSLFAM